MLILFDNGTPRSLARYQIAQHTVTEARARGWDELSNGELLTEAEVAGFEILITTDKNLRYRQNLTGRKIAVVVLGQGRWGLLKAHLNEIVAAVNEVTPVATSKWTFPMTKRNSNFHSDSASALIR
jgi:hypothetical protein